MRTHLSELTKADLITMRDCIFRRMVEQTQASHLPGIIPTQLKAMEKSIEAKGEIITILESEIERRNLIGE